MRILIALVLLALAPLFSFGFLASFEPTRGAWVWRIGYGAGILACMYGLMRLLREEAGKEQ